MQISVCLCFQFFALAFRFALHFQVPELKCVNTHCSAQGKHSPFLIRMTLKVFNVHSMHGTTCAYNPLRGDKRKRKEIHHCLERSGEPSQTDTEMQMTRRRDELKFHEER